MATAAILKFLSLKIMCTHVRQKKIWKILSNSEHHSKRTMNINSQHHNLLGNQITPKSDDFCIWWPSYTLVTMTMATILNFFNPQKLPHTTVDIPTKWIIIWLPNHGYQFPTSKSTWKPNFAQIGGFLYLAVILYLHYHGNGHHLEFLQPPQKLPHTMVDIPTKLHEIWWKESKNFVNSPFFVSMATVAKFVQPIPGFFWLISFH